MEGDGEEGGAGDADERGPVAEAGDGAERDGDAVPWEAAEEGAAEPFETAPEACEGEGGGDGGSDGVRADEGSAAGPDGWVEGEVGAEGERAWDGDVAEPPEGGEEEDCAEGPAHAEA